MTDNKLNERLSELLRFDARIILKDNNLKEEYISLHELIEGYKPSCTGCSAKSRLTAWKKKYASNKTITIKSKKPMSNNTFKLKRGVERVSVPFTGHVITSISSDDIVNHYIDGAKDKAEAERRKAFFEILPKKAKKVEKKEVTEVVEAPKVDIEELHLAYIDKFEKEVPKKYVKNADWIIEKLA